MTNNASTMRTQGSGLVWWLSLGQLVSWGSIYYSFSLFLEPMRESLGWTTHQASVAFSLGLLVSALFSVPVGRAIDKGHARFVMTGGSLLAAVMMLWWSQTDSLISFYIIWTGLGVVFAAVLYEPAFAVLVRYQAERQRHSITRMTLVGGFASTAFVPLTYWLIEMFDWRTALIVLAVVNLAVCAVIHRFVLPPPDAVRNVPGSTPAPLDRATRNSVIRTRAFLGLMLSFASSAFVFSALSAHLMPILQDRGGDTATALIAAVFIGPSQVAARMIMFVAGNRIDVRKLGLVTTMLLPASMLLLYFGSVSVWFTWLFAIAFGMCNGMLTLVRGGVVLEYFGRSGYGALAGMLAFPATIAKAAAPVAVAWLWNPVDRYNDVVWLLGVGALLSALAFWAARPPHATPAPVILQETRT